MKLIKKQNHSHRETSEDTMPKEEILRARIFSHHPCSKGQRMPAQVYLFLFERWHLALDLAKLDLDPIINPNPKKKKGYKYKYFRSNKNKST